MLPRVAIQLEGGRHGVGNFDAKQQFLKTVYRTHLHSRNRESKLLAIHFCVPHGRVGGKDTSYKVLSAARNSTQRLL